MKKYFLIGTFLLVIVCITHKSSGDSLQGDDLQFQCPPDWAQDGPYCYKYFKFKASYQSAKETCHRYGAALVNVNDATENQLVGEVVANSTDGTGEGQIYWIERRWWPTTTYSGFQEGPPAGNNCTVVAINKTELYKYSMRKSNCEKEYGFVCKMNACLTGLFLCANGRCIKNTVCDLVDDCGDYSDERNCSSQCTSVQQGTSGTINGVNKDCMWSIEGPSDSRITLTLSGLSLAQGEGYVEAWVGGRTLSTSTPVKRFYGTLTDDRTVNSTNNFMILVYSSYGISSNSFSAQWTAASYVAGDPTDLVATYDDKTIDYVSPIDAPYITTKIWIIRLGVKIETILTVTVLNMSLDSGDTISFYDGESAGGSQLYKLNSSDVASGVYPFMSVSSVMRIVLQKSSSSLRNSISFSYTAGCKSVISAARGIIRSPGYSFVSYPNNINCSWLVSSKNNDRLTLSIDGIYLNNMYTISLDGLVIFLGSDTNAPKFDLISRDVFVLENGTFLLHFNSSALFNGRGFQATFSTDCPTLTFNNLTIANGPLNTTLGSTIRLSCPTGYYFAQEEFMYYTDVVLVCSISGWKQIYGDAIINRTPKCFRRYCGQPDGIRNGYIMDATGVQYGDNVTYSCYPDFQMEGSKSITCLASGYWSLGPSCSGCVCPAVSISNGNFTYKALNSSECGAVVYFSCDPGYQLNGSVTVVCRNDSWTPPLPKCEKVLCLVPTMIPHSSFQPSSKYIAFQESISVKCDDGYSLNNATDVFLSCAANQSLDVPDAKCQDVDECVEMPFICGTNSTCTNTQGSYKCTCEAGFSSSNGANCTDIDECSSNQHDCSDFCNNTIGSYSCGCLPSRVLYTKNGTSSYFLPNSEDGLSPLDKYYINHTCVPISCQSIPPLTNGFINTTQTVFHHEDSVKFGCNLGYTLNGTNFTVCKSDGNWSFPFPSCEVVACFIPPNSSLSNLTAPPTFSTSAPVYYGQSVSFTCERYHSVPLTLSRTCVYDLKTDSYRLGLNRDWECPVVDCGPQPIIPGAQLTAPVNWVYKGSGWYTVLNTYYNASFSVSCPPSYVKLGTTGNNDSSLVVCGSDGRWITGDIRCDGPACTDPGTPPGARQIVPFSYESNYLVSFMCERDDFTPSYPYPMKCIPGINPSWNSSLPSCRDSTPPKWTNCPSNTITMDKYEAANFTPPVADDKSGLVQRVTVLAYRKTSGSIRPYFDPKVVLDQSYQVNYTAYDSRNNAGVCTVEIIVRDNRPPTISCSTVYLTARDTGILEYAFTKSYVTVGNYPSASAADVSVSFDPQVVVASIGSIGRSSIITATAKNSDGNVATCRFTAIIKAAPCSAYSLSRPVNATVSCNPPSDGSNSCNVTCLPGHFFYNSSLDRSGGKAKIYSCSAGQWSPSAVAADCMEPTFARFVPTYSLVFNVQQSGSPECYALAVQGWLGNAALTLQNSFQTLVDTTVFVSPGTPVQTSNITVLSSQQIRVNVGFDISTSNMSATTLNSYGEWAASRINGTTAQAADCSLTFQPAANLIYPNYSCLPYNLHQQTYGDIKYCFPCPRGFYFNRTTGCIPCDIGTYQDQPGFGPCKLCPANTTTALSGSTSQDDCHRLCSNRSPGMYGPTTKIAPCFDCPADKYAANDTCVDCAPFTHTRGTGKSSSDDCHSECRPGEYSEWGVEPCKKCPQHFYSSTNRSTYCVECGSNRATAGIGSTECFNETVICNVTEPCQNSGTCVAVNHQIHCNCLPGFTGVRCETQINYCISNPCYYNGRCVPQLNSYVCDCPQGFCYGTYHQLPNSSYAFERSELKAATGEDDCKAKCITDRNCYGIDWNFANSSCWFTTTENPTIINSKNVTHWVLKRDPYNCTSGRHCEVDFSSCASSSCQNGGFCRKVPPFSTNSPECICKLGFTGLKCEATMTNLCDRKNCSGHGFCSPVNSVRYQCNCVSGYTGADCSINIDDCVSNPCLYGGTCVDGVNGYTCNCSSGFTGLRCQNRSNPCADSPCGQTGKCVDDYANSDYFCLCNDGYKPRPSPTDVCSVSFTMLPGVGSERGTFASGLRTPSACQQFCVNLTSCVAVDYNTASDFCYYHTDPNALASSRYYNDPYIYQYVINRCPAEGTEKQCIKKDFCSEEPCKNGGTCTWSSSGSLCICPAGYTGSLCQKNIDDCASRPCQSGGTCVDGVNGYICQCPVGYNGTQCERAANACSFNPCNITGSERCENLVTSYKCHCKPGYNGVNCSVEIDECLSLPCLHGGICQNKINGYSCNCSTGWKGPRCENVIDYCSPNPCLNGGTCHTTLADYYCVCSRGSFGRNCELNYHSCNITFPCITKGSVCTENQGEDPTCTCSPENTGRGCQLSRNFCKSSGGICQNGAECISKLDDYECRCVQKYSGRSCDDIADSCQQAGCVAGKCVKKYSGHSCQCNLNFTTPNCQKELSSDFDLHFSDPSGTSYAVQSYTFELRSSQITCAFFIRYDQIGKSGGYFSLYGQQDWPVGSPLYPLVEMNNSAVVFIVWNGAKNISKTLKMSLDVVLNDTNWHHVAILWNCVTGWTELWIDSRRSAYQNFTDSIGYTLPPYGLVVLGSRLTTIADQYTLLKPGSGGGFEGYMSQVNIWSRVLSTPTEVPQLLNWKDLIYNGLVARWGNYEWKGLIVRVQPSTVGQRSPTTVVKELPEFDSCPDDQIILSSDERSAKYTLQKEPQPKQRTSNSQRKLTIKSKYKAGQTLAFGRYVNTYAILDDDGNAVTCSFSIYVQRKEQLCLDPKYAAADFSANCPALGYFKACSSQCPGNRIQSIEYPSIYTCGPEGRYNTWDPNRRLSLPSCSRPVKAKVRVYIRYIYRKLPNCEDQRGFGNIRTNLLNAIKALSTRWRGLCTSDCETVTKVNLTCGGSTNDRRKRSPAADMDVLVIIDDVETLLTSTKFAYLKLPPVDVVTADIYDNKSINFDYQGNIIPGTIPDPSTINVSYSYVCNTTAPLQGSDCVACTEGSYFDNTTGKCSPCPIGQYQNLTEQTSCILCPGGNTTESEGSRFLADCVKRCPAGSFYDNAVRDCQLCPFSFYQTRTGQFNCNPCPPTKESFVNGSTSDINCTDICPEGSQLMDGTCVNCTVGTYRDSSAEYCKTCPTGWTTDGEGAAHLWQCSVPLCSTGQFLNTANGTCVPCARGTYKPFTSLLNASDATCAECSDNKTTYAPGATSADQCVLACTYGYEDHNGTCTPCPVGFFKDNDNTTLCTLCPNNNLTNGTGAVSADNCTVANCTAGYRLSWNDTVSQCVECDYGQYQDEWWQTDCKLCPLDASGEKKTSLQQGLTDSSQCVPNCESGKEYDVSSQECVLCPRGFYREKNKNQVCELCDPENITADAGSISADNCTVANCSHGTFLTNDNRCEDCPVGRYQDKKWQTTCKPCPSGRAASTVGSTSINNCTNPCATNPCGDTKDCSVNLTAAPYFYQCKCKIGYEADKNGSCTGPSQLPYIYGGAIGGIVGAIVIALIAVGLVYALKPKPVPPPVTEPPPEPVVPEAIVERSAIFPESRALYRAPMHDQSDLQTSYVLKLPSVISDRGSLIRLNSTKP